MGAVRRLFLPTTRGAEGGGRGGFAAGFVSDMARSCMRSVEHPCASLNLAAQIAAPSEHSEARPLGARCSFASRPGDPPGDAGRGMWVSWPLGLAAARESRGREVDEQGGGLTRGDHMGECSTTRMAGFVLNGSVCVGCTLDGRRDRCRLVTSDCARIGSESRGWWWCVWLDRLDSPGPRSRGYPKGQLPGQPRRTEPTASAGYT